MVGCGGGDDSASSTEPVDVAPASPTLSQADVISSGDGICAEVNAAVGSIQASETSDEALKATQIADLYAGLADRLENLGTPSDGDAPVAMIEAARALGEAETVDATALSAFQTAAQEYGMMTCAETPVAPVDTGSSTGTGTDGGTSTAPDSAPAPTPAPDPAPAPAPTPTPPTGGGVAPTPPDTGGGSGGSSGGISPG